VGAVVPAGFRFRCVGLDANGASPPQCLRSLQSVSPLRFMWFSLFSGKAAARMDGARSSVGNITRSPSFNCHGFGSRSLLAIYLRLRNSCCVRRPRLMASGVEQQGPYQLRQRGIGTGLLHRHNGPSPPMTGPSKRIS